MHLRVQIYGKGQVARIIAVRENLLCALSSLVQKKKVRWELGSNKQEVEGKHQKTNQPCRELKRREPPSTWCSLVTTGYGTINRTPAKRR